jgi:hypothetical protein
VKGEGCRVKSEVEESGEGRVSMSNKGLFMEESIIGAVKALLVGRVNEVLGEAEFSVPPIEFSERQGGSYAIRPEIQLCECKRTEKDRIVRLDVYSLAVSFSVPGSDGERTCYAYAAAVDAAVAEIGRSAGLWTGRYLKAGNMLGRNTRTAGKIGN